jgi:prepilin-type processing-associated H-X9-DG protein
MSEQNPQAPPDRPRGRMSAWGWILSGQSSPSRPARALYDSSNLARNASDPGTSLPNPPRHLGSVIGYADGHVSAGRRQPAGP